MIRLPAAALVLIVGMLVAGVWAVAGTLDQLQRPAEFVRAAAPGSVELELTQVGPHVVYFEVPTGPRNQSDRPDSSSVIVSDPGGRAVAVRPYPSELSYDWRDRLGTAVAAFDAPRTGTYVISVDGDAPPGILAVGDDLAPDLLRALLPPATAVLATIAVAVLLVAAPVGPGRPTASRVN